jgi:hypothetical protein
MADLLDAEYATHARNDIVGGHSLRLIDKQHTGGIVIRWLRHNKKILGW